MKYSISSSLIGDSQLDKLWVHVTHKNKKRVPSTDILRREVVTYYKVV